MNQKKYDYLVVGSGLFGAVFACEMNRRGMKCLVVDKRTHTGGNTYCQNIDGINVHTYGAHIFHTNSESIWKYVNSFVPFNRFVNSPLAIYKNKVFNLPFNMNTFHQLWNVVTPDQARAKIKDQISLFNFKKPMNLEEQALSLVGPDIYNSLIKGYTEKQWGRNANDLPSFIIKRIPIRYTYDNNYFNDKFQGIPIGGYNVLTAGLLKGIEVRLNIDYLEKRTELDAIAKKIVYTGAIDSYFDYTFGKLEYRSVRFEHEKLAINDFQGNAVVNYTEAEIPYTRIIEHKHFENGNQPHTIITREYPEAHSGTAEPYYPINDKKNDTIYGRYKELASEQVNTIFGGRLAEYRYYDMHQVIASALKSVKNEMSKMG